MDETLSPSGATPGREWCSGRPATCRQNRCEATRLTPGTDFFSLGAVLYEMLCGHRAFPASSVVESGYAILHTEPEPLPTTVPPAVIQVVHRCLEKDPARRFQSARDLAFHLELLRVPPGSGLTTETSPEIAARPSAWKRWTRPPASTRFGVALAGVVLALAIFQLALRGRAPTAAPQLRLSQVTFAEGVESSPAWSGDGTSLAYSADVGNLRQIFVKNLQTGEEKRLTKSDFDDIQPGHGPRTAGRSSSHVHTKPGSVWSPPTCSGTTTTATSGQSTSRPATRRGSSRTRSIRLTLPTVSASRWMHPGRVRQIWILDAQGHNPQQVTSDISEAVVHVRPRWSPDGRRIVFQNIERTKFDVRVVDLASKTLAWITNDLYRDIDPVWSQSGRFVYFSSDRAGGLNLWRSEIAQDGAPAGPPQQLTTGAGQDVQAALSPDGKKLAFAILKQNADLWKLPVSQETGHAEGEPQEVLATTREDSRGAWSPDGKWIAFNSDRSGDMNIWLHSLADGSTRQLTKGPGGDFQPSWSPDGRWIVFFSSRSGNADIWKVEIASGKLFQLTKVPSIDINPFFSPDGRQIAYQSDQGGRLEVWLMSADGGEARELTRVGASGHFLRFTQDGRDVVFRCPTCGGKGQTMRVPVGGGDPQRVGDQAAARTSPSHLTSQGSWTSRATRPSGSRR